MARAEKLLQRVVGVGASAGGLEALRQLVSRVDRSGLAIVILQHLPESQTGQLAALLASVSNVPVIEGKTGHRIEPDTIVVVPPQTSATMQRGALILRKAKVGTRPNLPIDELFTSLGEALGARAIGVVLSGTGHDGTEGLRAIRAAGGATFAQDPKTAQFADMPSSAITAGVVGLVLAPDEIGAELATIEGGIQPGADATAIDRVLGQLRVASGIDFTSYKRSTIERRLARRLAKHHLSSLDDYNAYLASHPDEARTVYEDLLIHVTSFFRDAPVLDRLASSIVPTLMHDRASEAPLRVWVPGCSTGEEVYSIAMVLLEKLGDGQRLQLFGSDLSERAVEAARLGRYPASITEQVSAERLARFFVRDDDGYCIRKEVRERCLFVRHDVITDPPFSRVDIISCRNLLIYLGVPLQQRVIPILHYALNQPGYLILGRSESIAGFESMFAVADAEHHVYARKPGDRTTLTFGVANQVSRQPWRRPAELIREALDVRRDVDQLLLARYAPPSALVDENFDVVQFRGRTAAFLEHPSGHPQLNLVRMARESLATELRAALKAARDGDKPVRRKRLSVGKKHTINLDIVPVRGTGEAKRHFLVVFEDADGHADEPPPGRARSSKKRGAPTELALAREELAATKEYLASVVSQHVATSDELGIANEELQSTNEELQSSNEELQTAKEELQSTNEELETVNEELQRNSERLQEANDDLVNVLSSVEIAIIIVDTERRVRRFTPRARSVLKLLAADVGRPITDLQPSVALPGFDDMIAHAIETLEVHESEVRDVDGTWYRMQIRPYHTMQHSIGGAVIAFVDITALRAAREQAAAIVETVPTPLVVIDERQRVVSANAAFYTAFEVAPPTVVGRDLLAATEWRSKSLQEHLAKIVTDDIGFEDVEVDQGRVLRFGAQPFRSMEGARLFLIAIADVTERRRLEQARQLTQRERDNFLDAVSHELRTPLSAILLWAEALRELAPDDERRGHAIEMIVESARSEAQLVDDLLEVAQSRAAQLSIAVERVEPSTVVQSVVDASRTAANAKQIIIETTLPEGTSILGDPRRLKQIASNLISNAVKFTPNGGRVKVWLAIEHGALALRVRDSGPGIGAELLPHVFEPFKQADQSRTRATPGLGLGLTLVRHLVERLGGTIDVASPAGEGATFTVRIPAQPA